MLNYPSETPGQTPAGYGSRPMGKGATEVKPRYKDGEGAKASTSEGPNATPKGYSAKGPKNDGKGVTGGNDHKAVSNSESPEDTPEGYNDMEISHAHLPAFANLKEGTDVHLHVYGKVKSSNQTKGKNKSVVNVTGMKMHGDEDQSPSKAPSSTNMAKMPMDTLKGILSAGQGNEGKQQQRYGNKDNTPYSGY